MSAQASTPPRRQHPRTAIRARVHWHNRREEHAPAELYDASAQGVFLVPEGTLPAEIRPGDPVWIVVANAGTEVTLTGTIRWRGFHPGHAHPGCGIQLDPASFDAVERLFVSVAG